MDKRLDVIVDYSFRLVVVEGLFFLVCRNCCTFLNMAISCRRVSLYLLIKACM